MTHHRLWDKIQEVLKPKRPCRINRIIWVFTECYFSPGLKIWPAKQLMPWMNCLIQSSQLHMAAALIGLILLVNRDMPRLWYVSWSQVKGMVLRGFWPRQSISGTSAPQGFRLPMLHLMSTPTALAATNTVVPLLPLEFMEMKSVGVF